MNAADTNIWLYAVDHREPLKRQRAFALLEELAVGGDSVLLWQAASEFMNGL